MLLGAYFLILVPENEARLTDLAFRALAVTSDQIRSQIENYFEVMKVESERDVPKPVAELNESLPPVFQYEMSCAPVHSASSSANQRLDFRLGSPANTVSVLVNPESVTANPKARLSVDPGSEGYDLEFQYAASAASPRLCAKTSVEELVRLFLSDFPSDMFDDVLLARGDGTVLFERREEPGLRMSNLSSLFQAAERRRQSSDPTTAKTAPAADPVSNPSSGFSERVEFELKGAKYKVLLQPVPLAVDLLLAGRGQNFGPPGPCRCNRRQPA